MKTNNRVSSPSESANYEEGVPFSEIAVLFRSSSHSFDLEIELGKQGIPSEVRRYPLRRVGPHQGCAGLPARGGQTSDTLAWFRALKLIDHIGEATVYQILEHRESKQRSSAQPRQENLFKKLHRFPARQLSDAIDPFGASIHDGARKQLSR